MAVTEKQRHDLFNKLEEALGPDGAATLMDMLPPAGWADVATKQDLASLQQATKQEIAALRADVERRFDGLADVFVTKAELHQELRGQTRTFVGWMVTSQATLAAVVAMIVSLG